MFNVAERYVVSLRVKRRFSHRNSSFLIDNAKVSIKSMQNKAFSDLF